MEAWEEIPEEDRQKISKRGANLRNAMNYFCFKAGVRLTMGSLWESANAPEREDEDDTSAQTAVASFPLRISRPLGNAWSCC